MLEPKIIYCGVLPMIFILVTVIFITPLKQGLIVKETDNHGGASYKGIRQASIFIQNIDMNMEFTEAERADLKAQARFVRATIIGYYP